MVNERVPSTGFKIGVVTMPRTVLLVYRIGEPG